MALGRFVDGRCLTVAGGDTGSEVSTRFLVERASSGTQQLLAGSRLQSESTDWFDLLRVHWSIDHGVCSRSIDCPEAHDC